MLFKYILYFALESVKNRKHSKHLFITYRKILCFRIAYLHIELNEMCE